MITQQRLSIPTAAADGANQGSGLRRIVCFAALLVIFVTGVRAASPTYTATFYDGKEYVSKDRIALLALVRDSVLVSSTSDDGVTTFSTPDGVALVRYKDSNTPFSVPTYVTPEYQISKNLSSSTKSWLTRNYPSSMGGTTHINLHFQVAVNEQNFPDENFREWLLTQKYGADSLLTKDEIAGVISINVSEKNIANLKGIEYFTALTNLYCNDNKLKTLDVTKNTALEDLYCYGNQLKTLDLTKNTVLAYLSCNDNQLTSLDASKNTALVDLNCERNQLMSLLVSTNHKSMKMLCCYGNNLRGTAMTDLVNSMPTLTSTIDVAYFIVYNHLSTDNVITTIQAEIARAKGWRVATKDGNVYAGVDPGIAIDATNFPDANFRSWLLAQTYGSDGYLTPNELAGVTSINIKEKSIASLKGIEYFTALTWLSCAGNQLTELDLSQNTALETLSCYDNLLTSLDLSQNKKLTFLSCINNQIKGAGMATLVSSLPSVTSGDLYVYNNGGTEGNVITTVQVQAAKNKGWKVKDVSGNDYLGVAPGIAINATNFPDANFRSYVSNSCDRDKDGYLSDEEIQAETRMLLNYEGKIKNLKGIEYFTALAYLDCSGHELTTLDVSENKELIMLDCSRNQLTTLDVTNNGNLTEIYCYSNNISGSQMTAFVNSLPQVEFGTLYVVNDAGDSNVMTTTQVATAKGKKWQVMATNGSQYQGVVPEGLAINATNFPDANFRSWLLSQNYGDDGVLTDEEIVGVTEMNVSSKGIADLKGIEFFTALRDLNCYDNQLTALEVSKNTNLYQLECTGNQLTTLDLSKNTNLTILFCSHNQLTSLDVSKNTQLHEIYCTNNLIKGEGMNTFVNSLRYIDTNKESKGKLLVYYDDNSFINANVMTPQQVQIAKGKNWDVIYYDYYGNEHDYEGEVVDGDANGDGEIDETDLEIVRNIVLGVTPSGTYYKEGADVNGDGVVDIVDLTLLIEELTK